MGSLSQLHAVDKWEQAALDELKLSQESSEQIYEADALRAETPSRSHSNADDLVRSRGSSDGSDLQTDSDEGVAGASKSTTLPTLAMHSAGSWWTAKLYEHTGVKRGSFLKNAPVTLLSGCSGMLSEAKVFEAGPGSCFHSEIQAFALQVDKQSSF